MTASPVVVGVHVAKDRLDVAVRPSGATDRQAASPELRPTP